MSTIEIILGFLKMYDISGLLSGGAAVTIAAIAWITYRKINSSSLFDKWIERQSDIYRSFWEDEDCQKIRFCIVSDLGYEEIRGVLKKRNESNGEGLTAEEYALIESIDRFILPIARLRYFDTEFSYRTRGHYWTRFIKYWIARIEKRKELKEYIDKCWADAAIY
jgi:hypothetical protein